VSQSVLRVLSKLQVHAAIDKLNIFVWLKETESELHHIQQCCHNTAAMPE
jgi:hypothetical protein